LDACPDKSLTVCRGGGGGGIWPLWPPISVLTTVLPPACGMASAEQEQKEHATTNTNKESKFFIVLNIKN